MKLLVLLFLLSLAGGKKLKGKVSDYKVTQCIKFKSGLWDTPDKISQLSPAAPGDRVRIVQVKGDLTRITTRTIFPRALWVQSKALGDCVTGMERVGYFSSPKKKHRKMRFEDLDVKGALKGRRRRMDKKDKKDKVEKVEKVEKKEKKEKKEEKKEPKLDGKSRSKKEKKTKSYHKELRALRRKLHRLKKQALACELHDEACFSTAHAKVLAATKQYRRLCDADTVCEGKRRARRELKRLEAEERKSRMAKELRREARRAEKQARRLRRERLQERRRERAQQIKDAVHKRAEELRREKKQARRDRRRLRRARERRRKRRERRERRRREAKRRRREQEKRQRAKEEAEAAEAARQLKDEEWEAAKRTADAAVLAKEREAVFIKEKAAKERRKAEAKAARERSRREATRTFKPLTTEKPTQDPSQPFIGGVFCVSPGTKVYSSPTGLEGSMFSVEKENSFRLIDIVHGITHSYARVFDCMAFDYRVSYIRVTAFHVCQDPTFLAGRCEV